MKRIFKFSAAIIAIVFAASCQKESLDIQRQSLKSNMVEKTFVAEIAETKGAIDGKVAAWEVGDSLVIYDDVAIAAASTGITPGTAVSPTKDVFKVVSVSGSSVVITGLVSEGAKSYLAVYPYSAAGSLIAGSDTVTVTVPNYQIIPEGKNIDPKALVSVAKAAEGSSFSFKNAISLVKFTVTKADVTSVALQSLPGDYFVGTQRVDATSAEQGDKCFASKDALIVYAEPGKTLPAGDYYGAVIPTSLPNGLKLGCTAGDITYAKSSTNIPTFKRNGGLNLGTVDNGPALISDIKTLADFKAFAEAMDYYGPASVVKMSADVDFGGPSTEWVTPDAIFQGTFDGQNHRVYNFVCKSQDEVGNAGLFNTLGVGIENDPACVKNLCVGSKDYDFATKTGTYDGVSNISFSTVNASAYKYPGVIPYAHAYSKVDNVVNFMPVTVEASANTSHRAAGVCGTIKGNVTVTNCVNYGDITDKMTTGPKVGSSIGGVVGALDGTGSLVKGCVNYGTVTTQSPFVTYIGGISGPLANSVIEDCINNGDVIYDATHASVGSTSGYSNRAGGISSSMTGAGALIVKCVNNGNVYIKKVWGKTSKQTNPGLGGITGVMSASGSIKGCTNTGNVGPKDMNPNITGTFGGLLGYVTGTSSVMTITKADDGTPNRVSGKIGVDGDTQAGTLYIGGMVGYYNGEQAGVSVLECCEFTGEIFVKNQVKTVNFGIATIIGLTEPLRIKNCKSSGNISLSGSESGYMVGGIVGGSKLPKCVEDCEYSGNITINAGSNKTRIGGIVSLLKPESTSFRNNKFTGSITDTKATTIHLVGGLAGAISLKSTTGDQVTAEGCEASGTISVQTADKVGAVFGDLCTLAAASVKGNTSIGSSASPVAVGGSVNGTALTSSNYSSYLYGTQATNQSMADAGKIVFVSEYKAK